MSNRMKGKMEERADDRLVEQARQGDVEAFTELARQFQKRIYYTILALTKNHQDANDLAQETFMQAFKSLKGFKQRSSFYTWIYRIAVNLTLNFLKRRPREYESDVSKGRLTVEWNSSGSDLSPEKHSLSKELSERLKNAIDSLPLPYRASFTLVVFQEMTHDQAARVLRCSEKTVSWRMHKARKLLRLKLKSYLERS